MEPNDIDSVVVTPVIKMVPDIIGRVLNDEIFP